MNLLAQLDQASPVDDMGWNGYATGLVILMALTILIGAAVYYNRRRAGRRQPGLAGSPGEQGPAGRSRDGIEISGNTDL